MLKAGTGTARFGGGHDDDASRPGHLANFFLEERIEQQVRRGAWSAIEGVFDLAEEFAADDATAAPHQRDGAVVELPVVLFRGFAQQHVALGVADDFRGVERLLDVFDEFFAVRWLNHWLRTFAGLWLAATRSSLRAETQRANTASPIRVTGMPSSRALTPVHLPVPFWPAVSRILSTRASAVFALKARMSRVISIR